MEQGLVPATWMNRRLAVLEKDAERMAAYEEPNYQWNFTLSASCPPSTVVHMRGGRVWGDPTEWSGESWYVESASYDLADIADSGDAEWFTNPYYYVAFAVMLRWSGTPGTTPPLYIVKTTEYATAAEAEVACYPEISDVPSAFSPDAAYGIPLAIVIMRNNGNTALVNQYMPIDSVNRGRSYIWRNLKVRFQW